MPKPEPPGRRTFVWSVNRDGDGRNMPGEAACSKCGVQVSTRMPAATALRECDEVLAESVLGA